MSRIPKYKPWRPDFEAPGPHVEIEKFNGPSFQIVEYEDPNDRMDEDDDFPHYRYYESDRIIGRLYRAIDEREIFEEIQQRAANVGEDHRSTIIKALWDQILGACKLIQFDHLMDDARGIMDMSVSLFFLLLHFKTILTLTCVSQVRILYTKYHARLQLPPHAPPLRTRSLHRHNSRSNRRPESVPTRNVHHHEREVRRRYPSHRQLHHQRRRSAL